MVVPKVISVVVGVPQVLHRGYIVVTAQAVRNSVGTPTVSRMYRVRLITESRGD